MAAVGFYHLTRTPLEQALPKLLGRVLEGGGRAVVRAASAERLDALGAALWLSRDPDWLPHGDARAGDADLQPIWLTLEDGAPNGARHLFLADGAAGGDLGAFERVFDLFDGGDPEAVAAARARWSAAKAAGHALAYWRQGPRGWERGDG